MHPNAADWIVDWLTRLVFFSSCLCQRQTLAPSLQKLKWMCQTSWFHLPNKIKLCPVRVLGTHNEQRDWFLVGCAEKWKFQFQLVRDDDSEFNCALGLQWITEYNQYYHSVAHGDSLGLIRAPQTVHIPSFERKTLRESERVCYEEKRA